MKIFLAFVLALLICGAAHAQHANLDSLYSVWKDGSQSDSLRVAAYNNYIWNGFINTDPDSAFILAEALVIFAQEKQYPRAKAIAYGLQGISFLIKGDYAQALGYDQRSLKISEETGYTKGILSMLCNIGNIYNAQGRYSQALNYYQRSLKGFEETKNEHGISTTLGNIGMIYAAQGNSLQALDYYQRGLGITEEIGDKQGMGSFLNNSGIVYEAQGSYAKALDYYQRALEAFEEYGDKHGSAGALINIGSAYAKQGDHSRSMDYLQRGLKVNQELGIKDQVARSLVGIGTNYNKQGMYMRGVGECQKAWVQAKEIGAIDVQREACSCLYEAYKAMGNGNKALVYREQMAVLDDSLNAEATNKQLQQMEFAKVLVADSLQQEKEKVKVEWAHQQEVAQKDKIRNLLMGGGLLFVILSVGFFRRWRYVKRSRDVISKEKDRSDNLLLNILPAEIAEELKAKGRADARDFELVSILFTDFKGFTEASAKLSAQDLVSEINACFEAFDHIMATYGIEKIKTIGDAYMAAGGLPVPNADSTKNTVLAALDMQAFIKHRKAAHDAQGKPAFEMRVGIHTGPVVAGIVGVKKFQYDIWGDTVNTASRMESSGEVGQVNISEATYALVKDTAGLVFTSRGKVQAKGKGEMEMYFVDHASQPPGIAATALGT